jgi:hypothetical protein
MKRMKFVGLLALAAFAVMGVVASSAFASAPEFGRCVAKAGGKFATATCTTEKAGANKFEWESGPGPKNKFNSVIKEKTTATLETVKGTKITCSHEEGPGEIKNAKEVAKVVATFNGCKTSGLPCNSAGAGKEEIVTHSLGGVLGVEKVGETALKNKLATELHAEGGGNLAEFECSGLGVEVRGSVLHPATANKFTNKYTEKFAATKGEQKPSEFAGEPDDSHILESNTSGGPFEEAGQTITAIATFEEKIEASTIN